MAFINELKAWLRSGSMLAGLIKVNVAVLLAVRIAALVAMLAGSNPAAVVQWVALPAEPHIIASRPWTALTYMVAHYDVMHILFNMLWLYWLGMMFLDYFNSKQLVGLYVLGGLGGGALFVVASMLLPALHGGTLIGASASVLAIVVAVAITAPRRRVGLLLIGSIELRWIAVATIVLDVIATDPGNLGGGIAHLGGALVGLAYGLAMRQGTDITRLLNRLIDLGCNIARRLRRQPSPGKTTRKGEQPFGRPQPTEAEIDAVLDKIKRSGYASLTNAERDLLFNASRKR